jgi:predicted GNAT superfamily acetyltransferase
MHIRPALRKDFPAVLALNAESVHFLSPLGNARLEHLDKHSTLHCVIEREGVVGAFLLVFREGADYDSSNYQWFAQRYERFLYVDRVVVSSLLRGQGAGVLLYDQVFRYACEIGVPLVACEFDIDPPNPVSEQFHARYGFHEVGRQLVADGKKQVSLQVAEVSQRVSQALNVVMPDA